MRWVERKFGEKFYLFNIRYRINKKNTNGSSGHNGGNGIKKEAVDIVKV
jgi:hypothetical protein